MECRKKKGGREAGALSNTPIDGGLKRRMFFLLMESNYMVGSELKNKVLLGPGSDGMGIDQGSQFRRNFGEIPEKIPFPLVTGKRNFTTFR